MKTILQEINKFGINGESWNFIFSTAPGRLQVLIIYVCIVDTREFTEFLSISQ